MTEARASHLRLVVDQPASLSAREPQLRFLPVVNLIDGTPLGQCVETDIAFEDTCRPRHMSDAAHPSAAAWLGDLIERAGNLAHEKDLQARPIAIRAPIAALADRDMAMAAEAGARRTRLLPQEFRIDFEDASVGALEDQGLDRLESLRRRGFRIGLDARNSWRTALGSRARILFEAVRIDPTRINAGELPMSRLQLAAAEGVALIADNVRWRDAERLAPLGVRYAVAPRADS